MSEDPQQAPVRGDAQRHPAEVISPDEVAALLDSVKSGAVATDAGHAAEGRCGHTILPLASTSCAAAS